MTNIKPSRLIMAQLKDIIDWLNDYLKINDIKDDSWNGLQFEGGKEVNKIAFAVDACKETFNTALDAKADLLIVHHGMLWKQQNPSVVKSMKERVKILSKGALSLYASHLPLDRHKEVGNNAQLIKLLGGKIIEEFSLRDGVNVGWIARFKHPIPIHEITFVLEKQLNTRCKVLNFGVHKIEKLAVCSGGTTYKQFYEAMKQADAYLSGDAIEVTQTAKDSKFNVIFGGHYATETVGLKALMQVMQKRFKMDVVFIDKPTGL